MLFVSHGVECHPFARGAMFIHHLKFYFHGPPAFQYTSTQNPINAFRSPKHKHTNNTHLSTMPTEPIDIDALNTKIRYKCSHIFNKIPHQWQIDIGTAIHASLCSNSAHNHPIVHFSPPLPCHGPDTKSVERYTQHHQCYFF